MRTRGLVFTFSVTLGAAGFPAAHGETVSLALVLERPSYVVGEAVTGVVEVVNGGAEPVYLASPRPALRRRGPSGAWEPCSEGAFLFNPNPTERGVEIPGGGSRSYELDVRSLCSGLQQGQYELMASVHLRGEGRVLGPINSPTVLVEVALPVGEDLRAVEALGPSPMGRKRELLERFPTTTFAGWVLLQVPNGSRRTGTAAELVAEMIPGPPRGTFQTSDGAFVFRSSTEAATFYAEKARAFLDVLPEHPAAGVVRMKLGLAYVVLQEWQDGHDMLMASVSGPDWYGLDEAYQERWRRILKEFCQELIRRGLAQGTLPSAGSADATVAK